MLTTIHKSFARAGFIAFRFGSSGHHQPAPRPTKVQNAPWHLPYLNKPPVEQDPLSLSNLMNYPPFKSKAFLSLVSKLIANKQTEVQSDYFVPPKIHENSVFIYQSIHVSRYIRLARAVELAALPLYLSITTYPMVFVFTALMHYGIWYRDGVHELSKHLVVRMDLLPHIESIAVQKVGFGGCVCTKVIPVSDLEHITYETHTSYFWSLHKSLLDRHLVFRRISTGELLMFDREGFWSDEGLKHPLIF